MSWDLGVLYKFPCGCKLQSLGMLGACMMIECKLHTNDKEARDKLQSQIPKKELAKINKRLRKKYEDENK